MSDRIREQDLKLPALYIIEQCGGATTKEIKAALIDVFQPTGKDAEILAKRKDSRFTQIVRNLMGSHYATNGMDALTEKTKDVFSLTADGAAYLERHRDEVRYLFENPFAYSDAIALMDAAQSTEHKKRSVYVYQEEDMVSEGKARVTESVVKQRSRKLRQAALEHYTQPDGHIPCAVCGFDFWTEYGDLGRDYIQLHHEEPVYQYSDDGFHTYLADAIGKMKPVCANCHCMLHRRRGTPLTIAALEALRNAR